MFKLSTTLGELQQILDQFGVVIAGHEVISRRSLPVEVKLKSKSHPLIAATGSGNDFISALNSAAQKLGIVDQTIFIPTSAR